MTSEDKKLLEDAAKAANIEIKGWYIHSDGSTGAYIGAGESGAYECWNPLVNDGDALRLLSKLNIDITFVPNVKVVQTSYNTDVSYNEFYEGYNNDIEIAVRKAIVKAAAANGKRRVFI